MGQGMSDKEKPPRPGSLYRVTDEPFSGIRTPIWNRVNADHDAPPADVVGFLHAPSLFAVLGDPVENAYATRLVRIVTSTAVTGWISESNLRRAQKVE